MADVDSRSFIASQLTSAGSVHVSRFLVVARLVRLLFASFCFFAGNVLDLLAYGWFGFGKSRSAGDRWRRRMVRKAKRLRRAIVMVGGTFIKVGQQMSLRSDILPPIYCDELRSLLDSGDSLAPKYVAATIKEQTGRPLSRTFKLPFDFEPKGRASIACVYRATLLSGELVAVKVRRPNIVKIFTADLKALDWLLSTAEFLTILRPGITRSFRSELKQMLLEELDFRLEIRYQELFRRYFKKRKKLKVTAPKVYYELSGTEIIVSEFVSGIWMTELLEIVQRQDSAGLERIRQLNICPKKIAKTLIRASHYGFFECPFFHGDPHYANVLLQPDNNIVMIDFGACGVFGEKQRNYLRQMHYYQAKDDIAGMVRSVVLMMEPLPPIDVDAFSSRLEDAWWKGAYGIKSKHAEWWERTSVRLWVALLALVREYQIPLPLNMLRMIRATLLYDTVAAQIYNKIDVFKEYRKFYKGENKRVKKRIKKTIFRQLVHGIDASNYATLLRLWDVSNGLLFRLQNFLNIPLPKFASLVNKSYDLFLILFKWIYMTASVVVGACLLSVALNWQNLDWSKFLVDPIRQLRAAMPNYIAAGCVFLILVIAVKYLRQIRFRAGDIDL